MARTPKMPVTKPAPQAWLCSMDLGVEPHVVAGPFVKDVPERIIIEALQDKDYHEDEDLLFKAYVDNGKLTLEPFTGGEMEKLRAAAGLVAV